MSLRTSHLLFPHLSTYCRPIIEEQQSTYQEMQDFSATYGTMKREVFEFLRLMTISVFKGLNKNDKEGERSNDVASPKSMHTTPEHAYHPTHLCKPIQQLSAPCTWENMNVRSIERVSHWWRGVLHSRFGSNDDAKYAVEIVLFDWIWEILGVVGATVYLGRLEFSLAV